MVPNTPMGGTGTYSTWMVGLLVALLLVWCPRGFALAQERIQILEARYGAAGGGYLDATGRVQDHVRGARIRLHVSNATLGGDPAPNLKKTLSVRYRLNGLEHHVRAVEGQWLVTADAPAASAAAERGLVIVLAAYGLDDVQWDVTDRVQLQVLGNGILIQVTGDTMGGDPAPGKGKTLNVRYRLDGREFTALVPEWEWFVVSGLADGGPGHEKGITIVSARYGAHGRFIDATKQVRRYVRGNRVRVQVSNATMGGDPAPDRVKGLEVVYRTDETEYRVFVPEREWFVMGSELQP